MTLGEAFALCTGLVDGASDVIDEARVHVYNSLHDLARNLRCSPQDQQESASRCFERLLRGGPRSVDSDDRSLRAYLMQMLKNDVVDQIRRTRREVELDHRDTSATHEGRSPAQSPTPEDIWLEQEDEAQRLELAQWAAEFVFGELADQLAGRRPARYREDFLTAVSQLRRLSIQGDQFDDIVRQECGEVSTAMRNRVYQRHCRARTAFWLWLKEELTALDFPEKQATAIRVVVAAMRR
jgi:DNA-directed RNA polymerase specialized sigma24 family protein